MIAEWADTSGHNAFPELDKGGMVIARSRLRLGGNTLV